MFLGKYLFWLDEWPHTREFFIVWQTQAWPAVDGRQRFSARSCQNRPTLSWVSTTIFSSQSTIACKLQELGYRWKIRQWISHDVSPYQYAAEANACLFNVSLFFSLIGVAHCRRWEMGVVYVTCCQACMAFRRTEASSHSYRWKRRCWAFSGTFMSLCFWRFSLLVPLPIAKCAAALYKKLARRFKLFAHARQHVLSTWQCKVACFHADPRKTPALGWEVIHYPFYPKTLVQPSTSGFDG